MTEQPGESQPALNTNDVPETSLCDICGSDRVQWRKCKQLCLNCGTILKSCADL